MPNYVGKTFGMYCNPQLAEAFEEYCRNQDVRPSEVLRSLVLELLKDVA